MGWHQNLDLEVIEPDPAEWPETVDAPEPASSDERAPRSRPKLALTRTAVGASVVVAVIAGGAGLVLRDDHHGRHSPTSPTSPTSPASPASSACDAVPARVVAKLLESPRVTANLGSAGQCTWISSRPGRTALIIIQVYDAPLEAKTAFENQQAQSLDRRPWRFGDDAFIQSGAVHARGVALVGTVTVIADANGLAATAADVTAAQSIVELAAARLRRGWVPPRSSSLPLP